MTRVITQRVLTNTIKVTLVFFLAILNTGCFGGGSSTTAEERAFVEQWNQWLDDHPEEINDLRTRAIADNLPEEEIKREMIGLMVRFSTEANLDIPQKVIDSVKNSDYSPTNE